MQSLVRRVPRAQAQLHRAAATSAASAAAQRHLLPAAATAAAIVAPASHLTHVGVAAIAASPIARHFAAAAAAVPAKKGKKGAEAAVTAAADAVMLTEGAVYDEYNMIPPQPKPKYEELAAACLTEEQLRFAKRPMVSSEQRAAALPAVYVGQKPIAQHTVDDLGKYYTVDPAIMTQVPPNIHRTMAQEYMGGGPYHMIRNPGFEMVQAMKIMTEGKEERVKKLKQRVYGIRGESGCGKSAALHYAVQYAREASRAHPSRPWLVIATRADEFTTETKGFIAPSSVKEGIYDQALYTMDFFANLLTTEAAALKLIKLKRTRSYGDINWGEGVSNDLSTKTLFDLVTLASQDRAQAPRLLYDFTAELKRETEIPVLVAIDNLNIWDQVCEFIEPITYNQLDPRKLALVDAFSWFTERPPGNGTSMWAITTKHATLSKAHRHFQLRDVKGLDSWWYSAQELKQCVVHYSVSEFILADINEDLLARINGLTGKVPRDVFKQAFFR